MTYKVSILRRAQKELGSLPSEGYTRVRDAIAGLTEDPQAIRVPQVVRS